MTIQNVARKKKFNNHHLCKDHYINFLQNEVKRLENENKDLKNNNEVKDQKKK